MLSLPSKQGERIDLYTPLIKNIEEAFGPQVSSQVDGPLKKLQQLRDEVLQLASVRNDTAALDNLANSAKIYISMWNSIAQSFTFGREKVPAGDIFV